VTVTVFDEFPVSAIVNVWSWQTPVKWSHTLVFDRETVMVADVVPVADPPLTACAACRYAR